MNTPDFNEVSEPEKELERFHASIPGRAGEVFRRVEKLWRESYTGKRPDFEIELSVATPFGVARVVFLNTQGADTLSINVADDETDDHRLLYVPVEQCTFMLRHFKPKPDEKKIVVGFGLNPPPGI